MRGLAFDAAAERKQHVGVGIYHGEGAVLDALDHVRELGQTYSVVELTADPMRAGQLLAELGRERLRVSVFPQSDARMMPASNRLHAAITERRITLPDDPELAKHAANTIARHSRRGWRIDKPNGRIHNDAVVALAMALDRLENKPEPVRLVGWL